MYDFKKIFMVLGWPLGLVAVLVALLAWAGISEGQLVTIASGLIGLQLMQSVLIDVLKYAGIVDDGAAGKWSAAFNLVTMLAVAFYLRLFPTFDLSSFDQHVYDLAKLIGLIFAYMTQIVGTKAFHLIYQKSE